MGWRERRDCICRMERCLDVLWTRIASGRGSAVACGDANDSERLWDIIIMNVVHVVRYCDVPSGVTISHGKGRRRVRR